MRLSESRLPQCCTGMSRCLIPPNKPYIVVSDIHRMVRTVHNYPTPTSPIAPHVAADGVFRQPCSKGLESSTGQGTLDQLPLRQTL
jgi:hypothetical protein